MIKTIEPTTKSQQITALVALIALKAFTSQMGVSDVTAWRWRKKGWLHPINISGRQYLTAEDIALFKARAAAGEFSSPPRGAAARPKSSAAEQTPAEVQGPKNPFDD